MIRTVEHFQVGDEHRERRIVSDADVRGFAELPGDKNRSHLDDEYARGTRFGGRIAHGALLVAFVSKALGMDLPGPGAVYLSQSIEFLAPVFVGEEIEVVVRVEDVDREARMLTLANVLRNAKGAEVARGVSKVK